MNKKINNDSSRYMHEKTIDNFIKNFIQKDRRDRVSLLLGDSRKRNQFTNKLNHQWHTILDMRRITHIPKDANDYEFTKLHLSVSGAEPCLVISNYNDVDGKEMTFQQAFETVYGRGLASLVISLTGDKLYLETELVAGAQKRFVGKVTRTMN